MDDNRSRAFRPLLAPVVVALLGCGGDDDAAARPDGDAGADSDASTEPGGRVDYELFDNTRTIDDDALEALLEVSDDQSLLTFGRDTDWLQSLQPPNVILAGVSERTPGGLLRKVTSVERDGERVLVHTEPATVFHAFRRLDVEIEGPLGGEANALDASDLDGIGLARAQLTKSLTLGVTDHPVVLFDGDGQPSPEDRVAADVTMTATVTFHFWLQFDWQNKSVEEAFSELGDLLEDLGGLFTGQASLAEVLDLRTGFTLEGELESGLDLHGESALAFEKALPLAGFTIVPPLVIGPLVFVPTVSLIGTVAGGITGELDLGFGAGASVGAGFSYDADDGDPAPYTLGPEFSHQAPSATVTTQAAVRAELELRVNLQLYGFAGPYASLLAYANVDLDRTREPCFLLTAGLQAGAGASIGVFGHSLASFALANVPLGDPLELAEGDCQAPPEPPPTDAVITPWSRSFAETVWTTGTDEGFTNLERAHDGRLLVTSDGTEAVLKVDEAGNVAWARSFEQPGRSSGLFGLNPQHAIPTLAAGVLVATSEHVLIDLDAGGEVLRATQIETDNDEPGFRAAKQIGGDVWLAGTYRPVGTSGGGDRQAWLLLLDQHGGLKQSWTWGSPDLREAVRAILPLEDGALLVGDAGSFAMPGRAFALRVDRDGEVVWAKRIEGCGEGELIIADAIETDDGNLVLGGWFYATETRALLLRLAPDGSGDAPAWATETTIEPILGLEITGIHQLSTGELRVVGRWATTGDDKLFVAGTDAIGRFAWLRWYGGDQPSGQPALHVTGQGGLLIAAGSAAVEPAPGGLWLFEVPMLDGEIAFAPGSGATSEPLAFTSTSSCVMTPDAELATTALPVDFSDVTVEGNAISPPIQEQ